MFSAYKLFARIPAYFLFRVINLPRLLPINMVFVTTYKCNSRCKTCNIWRRMYIDNRKIENRELMLEEYRKIFRSIGNPYWITVEGGEPFLREDIDKIIILLYEIAHPQIISIPSNGSLPFVITSKVDNILNKCKNLKLILNLSLDHIGQDNDNLRGLNGNFELFRETIRNLKKLQNKNFTLGIHTVISKYNCKMITQIYDYVKNTFNPDSYIVENAQIRTELMNEKLCIMPEREDLLESINFFIAKLKKDRYKKMGKMIRAFRLNYYSSVRQFIQTGRMPYKCYAGFSSCQINPFGDVYVCATKNYFMGNLKEYGYSFRKLWSGSEAKNARRLMKMSNCSCTLANVSYTNMLMSPKFILRVYKNILLS